MGLNTVVILGSVRSDRQGLRAGKFVERTLAARGHDVTIVDPVRLNLCYSAGAFGGVRAAMQLRAMLCELGMPSIPSLFPIPKVRAAFDDDGRALDAAIDRRFVRFAAELEWYAAALREGRAKGVPY